MHYRFQPACSDLVTDYALNEGRPFDFPSASLRVNAQGPRRGTLEGGEEEGGRKGQEFT